MSLSRTNRIGSSREQIAIKEIRDDVLVLDKFRYRSVLEASSLNFELKSEAEQDAIIEVYKSFLNSLDGSIQIIIRTREIDIDNYLTNLLIMSGKEELPIYKTQLENYTNFVRGLVSVNKILSRNFYLVIPIDNHDKQEFAFIKEQISIKTDIVIKGLQRIGMHARALDGLEIANLFYNFYSPKESKTQPLKDAVLSQMHYLLTRSEA